MLYLFKYLRIGPYQISFSRSTTLRHFCMGRISTSLFIHEFPIPIPRDSKRSLCQKLEQTTIALFTQIPIHEALQSQNYIVKFGAYMSCEGVSVLFLLVTDTHYDKYFNGHLVWDTWFDGHFDAHLFWRTQWRTVDLMVSFLLWRAAVTTCPIMVTALTGIALLNN